MLHKCFVWLSNIGLLAFFYLAVLPPQALIHPKLSWRKCLYDYRVFKSFQRSTNLEKNCMVSKSFKSLFSISSRNRDETRNLEIRECHESLVLYTYNNQVKFSIYKRFFNWFQCCWYKFRNLEVSTHTYHIFCTDCTYVIRLVGIVDWLLWANALCVPCQRYRPTLPTESSDLCRAKSRNMKKERI